MCLVKDDRQLTRRREDEGDRAGDVLFISLRDVSAGRRERDARAAPGLVRVMRPRARGAFRRNGHGLSGGGEEAHT